MMLLEQIKNITEVDKELEMEYNDLLENITTLFEEYESMTDGDMPAPGMGDANARGEDLPNDEAVESALNDVVTQMQAAQKAMGMLNQMPDGPFRTKHRSRVMGNLNKIRGSFQRVMKLVRDTSDRGGYENANNYPSDVQPD